MAVSNYLSWGLDRVVQGGSRRLPGILPSQRVQIDSTSDLLSSVTQKVSNVSHELIEVSADITDDCLAVLLNESTTAIVQVGLDVSSTFYEFNSLSAKDSDGNQIPMIVPVLGGIASTYVLSDTLDSEITVHLYKIAA